MISEGSSGFSRALLFAVRFEAVVAPLEEGWLAPPPSQVLTVLDAMASRDMLAVEEFLGALPITTSLSIRLDDT